jgi:hypothetical protein
MGSIQSREDKCGARLTTVWIRCADYATPLYP